MKSFPIALHDSFTHIAQITDPETLKQLRSEGVRCDDEGYYTFTFGDHKEYEWAVEPIGEEGQYQMVLYKNRVPLCEKLQIWTKP